MPCRDADTFVSLKLLLIDPYGILLNCCNSSYSDTLSIENEDPGLKEDGSDVKEDPFICSGLQQWVFGDSE